MFTFGFIALFMLSTHFVSIQSDSYTIGIQQNRSIKPKWSKNEIRSDFCGGIFREKQVVIKSPRYPNLYPKNSNCEYTFYSPFVCINEFHIQFLDFKLEPSISCTKDKLIIGDDEVLCGQVVGIMKYKAKNGTLRIKFISDEIMENKGFELVVTRLPCSTEEKWNEKTMIPSISGSHSKLTHSLSLQKANPTSVPIPISHAESVPDTSIVKPICISQPTRNLSPIFNPAVPNPPSQPSCCANIFNQQTFYLISPGFPNIQHPSNCVFYIERHHPNICRLRIDFKYFLLGDWMQNQCTKNFLEIDGRRFCGCQTGFTYYTQLGSSLKSIRFANVQQYDGIQGFILEITQEECPHKSFQHFQIPSRLSMNHLMHAIDPRQCAFNYISYANPKMLAKSVCVRNSGRI